MIGWLQIIESPYLPARIQLRFPKKGPYWKRRNRRMQADPKNWSEPRFYQQGNRIYCHPSLIPLLRRAIESGKEQTK